MKRMAIFVEGFTELLFVEKLTAEIATTGHVLIDRVQLKGRPGRRQMAIVGGRTPNAGQQFYLLICDCQGYTSVASDIRDQYDSLVSKGYSAILGMRDVHPDARTAIPNIVRYLGYGVKTKPLAVTYVLAIMETEAWFLAEHTHLQRIDPSLTPAFVKTHMGFDPAVDDMTLRDVPSHDLAKIYALAGAQYRKGTRTTIDALDYANMVLTLASTVAGLGTLTSVDPRLLV